MAQPVTVVLPLPEAVREPFLRILDLRAGREVVTVVEILSPTNKQAGAGRDEYLGKRNDVLRSEANLVEIDLLRAGKRMPIWFAPEVYDYSILVSRRTMRDSADLYPFSVRDTPPIFRLPLRPAQPGPAVNLKQVFEEAYERGRLNQFIDYTKAPDPPLSTDDARWPDELLRSQGLRTAQPAPD